MIPHFPPSSMDWPDVLLAESAGQSQVAMHEIKVSE